MYFYECEARRGPFTDSKVITFSRGHSRPSLKISRKPDRRSTNDAKHDLAQRDAIIAEIEDLKVSWSERIRMLLLRDYPSLRPCGSISDWRIVSESCPHTGRKSGMQDKIFLLDMPNGAERTALRTHALNR